MNLLSWLTFLLRSLIVTLIVMFFWMYLFLLMLEFIQQWLSLHWEILIMLLSQSPSTLHQLQMGMIHFIAQLVDILGLIGMVFVITLEIFHGGISLNLVLLLLPVNFLSGFRLELMYIPNCKYQVKSHSPPWFSAACAAAIVHRNHCFCLYQ